MCARGKRTAASSAISRAGTRYPKPIASLDSTAGIEKAWKPAASSPGRTEETSLRSIRPRFASPCRRAGRTWFGRAMARGKAVAPLLGRCTTSRLRPLRLMPPSARWRLLAVPLDSIFTEMDGPHPENTYPQLTPGRQRNDLSAFIPTIRRRSPAPLATMAVETIPRWMSTYLASGAVPRKLRHPLRRQQAFLAALTRASFRWANPNESATRTI